MGTVRNTWTQTSPQPTKANGEVTLGRIIWTTLVYAIRLS